MKNHRIFHCITTLLVALYFLTSGVAVAETNVTLIRTLDRGVSLRSDPWVSTTNKITSIHADTTLEVFDEIKNGLGWYYVTYDGMWGYVAARDAEGRPFVTIVATKTPAPTQAPAYSTPVPTYTAAPSNAPYDMGVPQLHGQVYRLNQMNMDVYWVQVQLKATGIWYQGDIWDCTGNLGDQTMSEIASFMRSRGYRGHSGVVDQSVVNELAAYLGNRVVPVYVGGFYDSMNSIMVGGSSGSMYQITSNLRDMVARETTGARWVQAVLMRLGYYNSTIDGKYGEGTDQAVRRFQKDHGFQERDYVSLGVARAMLEQYYYRGYSIYELP